LTNLASENQNNIYRLYQMFTEHHVRWAYCGNFTSEKTDLIIRFFESFLDQQDIVQKIQKRAFYIFVEGIQNVHRHQITSGDLSVLRQGFLLFQQQDQHIAFTMGNMINKSQEEAIASRLDSLNKMSREELNNHYKKVLKNEVLSDKGGAGLGLIEIARKSQNLLNYHFVPVNEKTSSFYLKMVVSEVGINLLSTSSPDVFGPHSNFHQILADNGISLSFHEKTPAKLPTQLRSKTSIILPGKYPGWSGNMFFSIIDILHDVFPDIDSLRYPGFIFFQTSGTMFNIISGLTIPSSETGSINKVPEILKEEKYREMKNLLSKPPSIQLTDLPGKKQFISLTFSFPL
jgi:hypothetical protein